MAISAVSVEASSSRNLDAAFGSAPNLPPPSEPPEDNNSAVGELVAAAPMETHIEADPHRPPPDEPPRATASGALAAPIGSTNGGRSWFAMPASFNLMTTERWYEFFKKGGAGDLYSGRRVGFQESERGH